MTNEIQKVYSSVLCKMINGAPGDTLLLEAALQSDSPVMTSAGSQNDEIFRALISIGCAAPADLGLQAEGIELRCYKFTPAGKKPAQQLISTWKVEVRDRDEKLSRLQRICDEVGPRMVRDLEVAVVERGGGGLECFFALSLAITIYASSADDPLKVIDDLAVNAKNALGRKNLSVT